MKNYLKLNLVISTMLVIVMLSNSNAQTDYSFDHPFKSESDHSKFLKERFEQNKLFDNAVPQKFLKNNFTEDLLDSVEYSLALLNYKEFNSYDGNGKILNIIKQSDANDTGLWTDQARTTFSYDNKGHLINLLYEIKADLGNTFQKKESYSYTYNIEGKRILELHEKWDYNSSDSLYKERENYTYDEAGNLVEILQQEWQMIDSSWYNLEKDLFSYGNDGERLTWTNEIWITSLGEWVGMYNHTYSYGTDGKIVFQKKDKWSYADSAWINYNRINYSYNDNGDISYELVEKFDNNTWKNMRLHTYTYDNDNNLIEYLWQLWLSNSSIWGNAELQTYSYDENGNLISESFKVWEGIWNSHFTKLYTYYTSGSLKNFSYIDELGRGPVNGFVSIFNNLMEFKYTCEELTAYYSPLTDINDSENLIDEYSLSQNYPNPFNPTTTISYTLPFESSVTIEIFDVTGSLIQKFVSSNKQAGHHNFIWNGKNSSNIDAASGVYIYRFIATSLESKEVFSKSDKMMMVR
jgi:hypothetical protein